MTLSLTPIEYIPMIQPGDDLGELICEALSRSGIKIIENDILVITQKIVSKSENRLVNLTEVIPSQKAIDLSVIVHKDPRLVEIVLLESKSILRAAPGILIVEHNLGFICANAGIDHSNVNGPWGEQMDWVLMLPKDPDGSASRLRTKIEKITSVKNIGILIIDSHSRAWRIGTVGTTIGLAGVPGIVDLRGKKDVFGYKMQYTIVSAADELAAAASLVMGQIDEKKPVVHVRGFPYSLRESHLGELLRPEAQDLFR